MTHSHIASTFFSKSFGEFWFVCGMFMVLLFGTICLFWFEDVYGMFMWFGLVGWFVALGWS